MLLLFYIIISHVFSCSHVSLFKSLHIVSLHVFFGLPCWSSWGSHSKWCHPWDVMVGSPSKVSCHSKVCYIADLAHEITPSLPCLLCGDMLCSLGCWLTVWLYWIYGSHQNQKSKSSMNLDRDLHLPSVWNLVFDLTSWPLITYFVCCSAPRPMSCMLFHYLSQATT